MHTITVSTDTESRDYSVPENFAEMSGRQLIVACSILLGNTSEDAVEALTGIGNEILSAMSPFQMYNITQLFESWNSKTESICFKEWKIPEIKVGDTVYYGPTSNFGNITWGEFVYADQCMMQGYHKAVVAALFRQKRKGYDGETDIRIPFTTYGTSKRFKEMNELDEETMLSIILNYRAVRAASLEATYTQIFPYHDAKVEPSNPDLPDDTPPEPEETASQPFSWTNIHRNLLGDNIQDEDKYLQLPVHTVLHRLNQLIEESKKNKKLI